MGACTFRHKIRAKSMKEAYKTLVEEALEEYGSGSYNGTISTTTGFADKTEHFKNSKMKIQDYIDKYIEDASKWGNAFGVCVKEPVGNTNKIKTKVEHVIVPGTKKWELKYVVYTKWGDEKMVGSFNTKGDAVTKARDYTEKTQNATVIVMEKKLEKGDNKVAEVIYKKSDKESEGEYVFFGWAAE